MYGTVHGPAPPGDWSACSATGALAGACAGPAAGAGAVSRASARSNTEDAWSLVVSGYETPG